MPCLKNQHFLFLLPTLEELDELVAVEVLEEELQVEQVERLVWQGVQVLGVVVWAGLKSREQVIGP